MIFPLKTSIFPMVSHGFSNGFSHGFFRPRSWRRPRPWSVPCPRRRSARGGPTGRCLELSGARKDSELASGDFYGDFDGGWMVILMGIYWKWWFMTDVWMIYGWFTGLRTWKWWFITDLWMIYRFANLEMVIYYWFMDDLPIEHGDL